MADATYPFRNSLYESRSVTLGFSAPVGVDVGESAPNVPIREGLWYEVFAVGHPVLIGKHRQYAKLPFSPRCKLCQVPFRGVGWIMRHRGWRPSPRNVDYCLVCDNFIRDNEGVADVVMPILFVDLCNSTLIGQLVTNAVYRQRRKIYRAEIAAVLRECDGFVLEEAGDQVIGMFPPGLMPVDAANRDPSELVKRAANRAVDCALTLARSVAARIEAKCGFTFGAAVHIGDVRIGAAFRPDGGGPAVEINGPPANVSARLASIARPGDVLVTDALLTASGRVLPECARYAFAPFELKGVTGELGVHVVTGASGTIP
jgi:adenylate cyclase